MVKDISKTHAWHSDGQGALDDKVAHRLRLLKLGETITTIFERTFRVATDSNYKYPDCPVAVRMTDQYLLVEEKFGRTVAVHCYDREGEQDLRWSEDIIEEELEYSVTRLEVTIREPYLHVLTEEGEDGIYQMVISLSDGRLLDLHGSLKFAGDGVNLWTTPTGWGPQQWRDGHRPRNGRHHCTARRRRYSVLPQGQKQGVCKYLY